MFCGNCGKENSDGSRFCTVCGSPLTENASYPAADQGSFAADKTQQFAPAHVEQQPAPAGKAKGGSGKTAPIVAAIVSSACIVILVLVLIGTGFIQLGRGGESEDSGVQTEQVEETTPEQNTEEQHEDVVEDAPDIVKQPIGMAISQVDNSSFPKVTLYASITDSSGNHIDPPQASQLVVTEIGSSGQSYVASVDEIISMQDDGAMCINLVLDQSGSMSSSSKMSNAKAAANEFIDEIVKSDSNQAEITSFENNVYNRQPFTSDETLLRSAVDSLSPSGETALYDSLYWALYRTSLRSGSRVVIAFTDGQENASKCTLSDVEELSRTTGIPVYIVGVGGEVDRQSLTSLASACSGQYFDASTSDLASKLAEIYNDIYALQRSMCRITFTSSFTDAQSDYRTVRISCADDSPYEGEAQREYMPTYDVSITDGKILNMQDYILPDSDSRYYSESELEQLSLWELYLARNEIFARHGRGFKKQDLQEYFATKSWYKELYSPEEFDSMPDPLNDYEKKNAEAMLAIEKRLNSPYYTR